MVRIRTRTFAAVATAVAVFAFAGPPAGAQQPIGPNQHFAGRVNGTRTSAVVHTVCAGPVVGRPHRASRGRSDTLGCAGADKATVARGRSARSTPGSFLKAARRPRPCS